MVVCVQSQGRREDGQGLVWVLLLHLYQPHAIEKHEPAKVAPSPCNWGSHASLHGGHPLVEPLLLYMQFRHHFKVVAFEPCIKDQLRQTLPCNDVATVDAA